MSQYVVHVNLSSRRSTRSHTVSSSAGPTSEATQLLIDWTDGDKEAVDALFPLVYEELREIAHYRLQQLRPGDTIQTTALVHDAYLRLTDHTRLDWSDRAHFLALASRAMRNILVDYARRRNAQKRGGGAPHFSLAKQQIGTHQGVELFISLDQALTRMAALDERLCRVVECRFFAELRDRETAQALGVSVRTVRRDWAKAKAWLYDALTTSKDESPEA